MTNPPATSPFLITLEEAARRLGISRRTLQRVIDERQIPFYNLAATGKKRLTRLNWDEVLEWVQKERRVEPTS